MDIFPDMDGKDREPMALVLIIFDETFLKESTVL